MPGRDDRLRVAEKSGLVGLDLHEILAVRTGHRPRGLLLAVKRIGADERIREVRLPEQTPADRQLALVSLALLVARDSDGNGRARLGVDHGHDAHHVLDELPVKRKLPGQGPVLGRHPRGELPPEVVKVEPLEEIVQRHVARDPVLVLRHDARRALRVRHAQLPALGHRQPLGEPRDRLDGIRPAHHRHHDDRQDPSDGEAPVPVAMVLHMTESLVERFPRSDVEGHHAVGIPHRPPTAVLGKLARIQQPQGVPVERPYPQRFRPVVRNVEVAFLTVRPREALRDAQRRPVRGLVARPRRTLDVAERLREKRPVPEFANPESGQLPRRESEALRGEVLSLAGPLQDREAAVGDDELEPLHPEGRGPSDVFVPGLQMVARGPPDHEGRPFSAFFDDEPHRVTARMRFAHVVILALKRLEPLDFVSALNFSNRQRHRNLDFLTLVRRL